MSESSENKQQANESDIGELTEDLSKILKENISLLVRLSVHSETLIDDVKALDSNNHHIFVDALKKLNELEQQVLTIKNESTGIVEKLKSQIEDFSSSDLQAEFKIAASKTTQTVEESKKELKSSVDKIKRWTDSNVKKFEQSQKEIDETFDQFNKSLNERFKQFDAFLPAVAKKLTLLGVGFFMVTSIVGGSIGFLSAHAFTKSTIVEKSLNESAELRENLILLHEFGIQPAIYQNTQGQKFIQIKGVNTLGMPVKNSSGNYSIPIKR
ncbi:MAG: hypothetical protein U9N57_14190 [Pseudomonadota bacterium]|nr:hypothetical protein [Pseudomonadota bacterium]